MHSLEGSGETKVHVIDFEQLKAEAASTSAPAPSKEEKAQKEKEDARIDGAVQIAIGVKKEVDFPTWYTNVSFSMVFRTSSSCLTVRLQVLIKADMLDYYSVSGCYILKPWSYSIWEIIQGPFTFLH